MSSGMFGISGKSRISMVPCLGNNNWEKMKYPVFQMLWKTIAGNVMQNLVGVSFAAEMAAEYAALPGE
jgi:hypothetical protein